MANIFFDIGTVIITATLFAYIARFLKQPLIPAYILTGLFIGPILGLVTNQEVISTLSEIGIAFLLFIVGLEIDIRKLKYVGLVASFGGIIQLALTSAAAFAFSVAAGFAIIESVYIALIVAFSSTMVVVKLLSDRKETDTLHGKIIIGILLLQDLAAIIALSALASLSNFSLAALVFSILKGAMGIILAVWLGRYFFPQIFTFAAKSQELLFISSISLSFVYSIFFSYLGMSVAVGAFVAGVSLANLPYNIEIISKIKPLRDFFSVIFFVSLGMQLLLGNFSSLVRPLFILLILAIVFKPLITMVTTSLFGYKKRTSFLTAISLAQISEFSLIIAAQGMILGHVSREIFSLTVLIATLTIVSTTYFMKYEDKIYGKFSALLSFLDRLSSKNLEKEDMLLSRNYEVILCGYNRIGYSIVKTLKKIKKRLLVVDFNPEVVKHMNARDIPSIYGDIGDMDVLDRLNFKKAKIVISTVPTRADNMLLIKSARKENSKTVIFVTASQIQEALELYDAGADYVIMPHFLGGNYISVLIEKMKDDLGKVVEHKLKHIAELRERHSLGHEHPS